MKNVLLGLIVNEDGSINYERAKTLIPAIDHDSLTITNEIDKNVIEDRLFDILCNMRLDDEFIENYFDKFDLYDLTINNNIPFNALVNNMDKVLYYLIHGQRTGKASRLLFSILDGDHPIEFNEELVTKLFISCGVQNLHEDTYGILNAYASRFNLEFIMEFDSVFSILLSILNRNDENLEQIAFENIDEIEIDEILTVLSEIESLPRDDNGNKLYDSMFTERNEELLKKLLYKKFYE